VPMARFAELYSFGKSCAGPIADCFDLKGHAHGAAVQICFRQTGY
jgi:hypothetical protein